MTALGIALALLAAQPGAWPEVASVTKKIHLEDVRAARLDIPIRSAAGEALYTLSCRSWWSATDAEVDFDYAGDLDCHLYRVGLTRREGNLLVELKGDAAFWGRGRFLAEEVKTRGAPLRRTASLRGMKIVIVLDRAHLVFEPPPGEKDLPIWQIRTCDLTVSVEPQQSATNAYLWSEPQRSK